MLTRFLLTTPLFGLLISSSSFTVQQCGGDDDDDVSPTPQSDLTDIERFNVYLDDLQTASNNDERDSLTQNFFRTIQYSDGFPIHDGNTVTFVYEQESGVNEPLSVVGDFNNWNTTLNSLTRAVNGYWVFYTTISLADPTAYSLYKFYGQGDSGDELYFADPVGRRYQYDSYGKYTLTHGGTQTDPSHLERYPLFHSDYLPSDRDLFLYVPPGYEHESSRYPVLYMHDGQNLFDPEAYYGSWKVDQVIDDLLARSQMEEILVVGIANTYERMDEYTHTEDFISGYGYVGGDGELYAQLIALELKPFIDEHYRTESSRESTGVLGSSLGGLISFYIGSLFPDVFGYVGGMSSTLGWGSIGTMVHNPTVIEILDDAQKLPLQYYLDSGGGDGGGCVDADGDGIEDDTLTSEDNYCETYQLYEVFQETGYTEDELLYVYAPGQEHNEASWSSRLHYPLTFWFGTDAP